MKFAHETLASGGQKCIISLGEVRKPLRRAEQTLGKIGGRKRNANDCLKADFTNLNIAAVIMRHLHLSASANLLLSRGLKQLPAGLHSMARMPRQPVRFFPVQNRGGWRHQQAAMLQQASFKPSRTSPLVRRLILQVLRIARIKLSSVGLVFKVSTSARPA